MKYPIRYFSIGLFTASLIVLIGYYLLEPASTSPVDETVDEMIDIVEKEGYRVIDESEYISLATAKNELSTLKKDQEDNNSETKENSDKEKQDKKKDEPKKETKKKSDSDKKDTNKEKDNDNDKEKDDVVKYTLVVEPNMVPSEISKILEENKVIKDATDFNQYMEENDYSPYLQIGEFKLTSDMSRKEIAQMITSN